jgi:CRISPR-associated protein Csx17
MAGQVLELRGCTPEPLGNYLKGLGVFRLIAEQADPQARAWWEGGVLRLWSRFSRDEELRNWFRDDYAPSSFLAPWSVNSGVWPPKKQPPPRGDKRGTPNTIFRHLEGTTCDRFRAFRQSVVQFLRLLDGGPKLAAQEGELSAGLKALLKELESQSKKGGARARLLRAMRNSLEDSGSVRWLDAVGTVRSGRENAAVLFSLLADGAAEGVNSFIGNFYGRLCDHLPVSKLPGEFWSSEEGRLSLARLENALFGTATIGAREADAAGGLYWPGLVEAPNIGQQFLANPKKRAQPWEFILAMEGMPLWSAAATRRSELLPNDRVSFPFYCDSCLGGSSSLALTEIPGSESKTNGEIWCPVWSAPALIGEIGRLFTEGRLIAFDQTATRATQFAVAVASLGIERGIVAFQRVGLLERSGSGDHTTSLAISLGSWAPRRLANLHLLDELRTFEESVASNLQPNANQPRRLLFARQAFEAAIFSVAGQVAAEDPQTQHDVLREALTTAVRLEQELAPTMGKVKYKVGEQLSERRINPIQALSRCWSRVLSERDRESRLARAIAGISAWGSLSSQGRERRAAEAIRANLVPVVRPWKSWQWFDPKTHKGFHDALVWSRGTPLAANLARVLRRRLIDARRGEGEGLPLWSPHGASFSDLLSFWEGEIDEDRLANLIGAVSLIDIGPWRQAEIDERQVCEEATPNVKSSAVWFDHDEPRITLQLPARLTEEELHSATALPQVYALLKLCFVGGRLPRRPVEGETVARSGSEPFPPECLDVLSLLEAGRLSDAAQVAARRLRAKGYPAVLRELDIVSLEMDANRCRRLAGMLLIPVSQPGVLAALAVKPEVTRR